MKLILTMAMLLGLSLPAAAQSGLASWYAEGKQTANGERFNPDGLTCAHRSLPFGTQLRVSYNGRSTVCRVNDRGPFIRGRVLDLSRGTARALGMLGAGVVRVDFHEL